MSIQFREIDHSNWEVCTSLRVRSDQEGFVAQNWYSLLQAHYELESMTLLGIYVEEVMVGFLMYGVDPETKRVELCRFMIDQHQQGKGYGKEALRHLLSRVKEEYGAITFYTSVEPENIHTLGLYESFGFVKTGEIMWEEIVLNITLS